MDGVVIDDTCEQQGALCFVPYLWYCLVGCEKTWSEEVVGC